MVTLSGLSECVQSMKRAFLPIFICEGLFGLRTTYTVQFSGKFILLCVFIVVFVSLFSGFPLLRELP